MSIITHNVSQAAGDKQGKTLQDLLLTKIMVSPSTGLFNQKIDFVTDFLLYGAHNLNK